MLVILVITSSHHEFRRQPSSPFSYRFLSHVADEKAGSQGVVPVTLGYFFENSRFVLSHNVAKGMAGLTIDMPLSRDRLADFTIVPELRVDQGVDRDSLLVGLVGRDGVQCL